MVISAAFLVCVSDSFRCDSPWVLNFIPSNASKFYLETAQSGTANIDHPIVRVSLYPSHVPQGATPTLFCEVVGTSKAVTVKWMKDGNPLPMGNNRFRTAPWTEGHILQIRFLKASDAGSYTCVASGKDNSSQSDSKMLYVIGMSFIDISP